MRTFAIRIYQTLTHSYAQQSSKRKITWVLKALITLAVITYIIVRLSSENVSYTTYVTTILGVGLPGLIIALLGMPLNLGLETTKWWYMMQRDESANLSFLQAFRSVFSGLSTGIFTPNRIGEYAGRVAYLPPALRIRGALYMFVDRLCQMIITLWMGSLAFEFFLTNYPEQLLSFPGLEMNHIIWIRFGLLGISLLAPLALILVPLVLRKLDFRFSKGFWNKLMAAMNSVSPGLVVRILFLGLLRYMVFSLQYWVLLYFVGYDGPLMLALTMVWMIFLIKSVIPSVTITELGIRESVALAVMGVFAVPAYISFSTTFVLYIINIVIPSCIGLYFIYRLKL